MKVVINPGGVPAEKIGSLGSCRPHRIYIDINGDPFVALLKDGKVVAKPLTRDFVSLWAQVVPPFTEAPIGYKVTVSFEQVEEDR